MDQHGLSRADMVPILGTPSRVSEVLGGKKGLSMAMVQRLAMQQKRDHHARIERRLVPASRNCGSTMGQAIACILCDEARI
jgi:hypothetical protein